MLNLIKVNHFYGKFNLYIFMSVYYKYLYEIFKYTWDISGAIKI